MIGNIIHCPHGPHRNACWESFKKLANSLPQKEHSPFPEITFITYNNRGGQCLAENSFIHFGFKNWMVLSKDCQKWTWMCKITPAIDFLKKCNTQYVCAIDGDDCVVYDPTKLLDKYKKYNCDMLFGNTPVDYPPDPECRSFERSVYTGIKPHLNATYIGKTKTILEILIEVEKLGNEGWEWTKGEERTFHDQRTLRHLHKKYYPRLMVDYQQNIFTRIDEIFLRYKNLIPLL